MTQLNRRLQRLEVGRDSEFELPEIIFVKFCALSGQGKATDRLGLALFVGRDIPDMRPEDGESDAAFEARAHAVLEAAKTEASNTGARP